MLEVPGDVDALAPHWPALVDAGLAGVVEHASHTELYFHARPRGLALDGRWRAVASRDWEARWRRGLAPVRVGRWTVTPPWLATGADGELVIHPGQAFGTGHHETTVACLSALDALALAGRTVLDVGTGTGVLAIAAAAAGARVVAVDIDPLAVAAAGDNAARNGVTIDVRRGSVAAVPGDFDVVTANLDTATLTAVAAALAGALAPGGELIAAGVSNERAGEAGRALVDAGLRVRSTPGRAWTLLHARHGTDGTPHRG